MQPQFIFNNMIVMQKLFSVKRLEWGIGSIWLLFNLSLLIIASRQTAVADNRIAYIYPFNYHMVNTCLWAYDITEFIGYALILPPIITFLFKKIQKAEKSCFNRMMIFAFKTYIIYCFGFVVIAYLDDSAVIEFYLTLAKAIAMMIVTYYVADDIWDAITKLIKK